MAIGRDSRNDWFNSGAGNGRSFQEHNRRVRAFRLAHARIKTGRTKDGRVILRLLDSTTVNLIAVLPRNSQN